VPLPAEAKLTLPGCAFAYWTSSAVEVTGRSTLTKSIAAISVIRDTGAKSRTGSKRRLPYRLRLIACVPLVP
jgi:hypothetical protein